MAKLQSLFKNIIHTLLKNHNKVNVLRELKFLSAKVYLLVPTCLKIAHE